MNRIFTLILVFSLLCSAGFAQILNGPAAFEAFPGANKVRLDEKTSLPLHIQMMADQRLSVDGAIHYLTSHAGLGEETSFELIRRNTDQMGMTHHRYQQLINGVPIASGVYLFHTENGIVRSMNGELFQLENTSTQTTISAEKAIEVAIAPYEGGTYGWETKHGGGSDQNLSEYPDPQLTWVPVGLNFEAGDFRLAYKMDVYAMHDDHHHRSWTFVDAQTGEIIAKENRICDMDVPAQASTNYSGQREVLVEQLSDDLYRLRQTTYGNGISTLNLQNSTEAGDAVDFTHEDTDWAGEIGVYDRYALDAQFASEQYYLFLLEYFNRNSINEEGLELRCYIHYGENVGNAFWTGEASFYGDGGGGNLDLPTVSVDIVAHEFTHGLTDYTADLIYAYESGALNESFSDLFGLATDFYARPEAADWTMGEDATSSGTGIRSAFNPKIFGHPANYQGENWWTSAGDNGGVHINSGVQNHWYYLLSEGGTGINDNGEEFEVIGIGWEKAIAVAYRNISTYLTAGSTYNDAAYYGAISALDLFGSCSQEYRSTVNAWHAVGLGEAISEEIIIDFQSQTNFCNAPATVQFYNFSNNYESVLWTFGDGNTSTEFSPSHTYMAQGTYDVSLMVTYCNGESTNLIKENYISIDISDPVCNALIMLDSGLISLRECSGTILDPGGVNDYPNNVESVVVINPPTNEPIIAVFEQFSTRFGDQVRIYDGPSVSSPQLVQLQGNIDAGETIESSGGAMTIRFTSNDEDIRPGFILSYSTTSTSGAPQASFTPSSIEPALNAPVTFMDNSQFAGEYFWDFGDGTTSIETEPTHQYVESGTYQVKQVITNCDGIDSTSVNLTVSAPGILNLNPDSICVTLNAGDQADVSFFINNSGLGDLYYGISESTIGWLELAEQSGEIAPSENTEINLHFDASDLVADTFYYQIPMVSGDTSQLTLEFPVKLIVLPFPQASFSIEVADLCSGTYQFIDQTLNQPETWLWNFGDGNTSTDTFPIHQFDEEGVYDVSLLVCNALGCDSVIQEQLIVVSACDSLTMTETGYSYFDNCNGIIYDNGGPDDDYLNNTDYIVTIAPTGADFVTLTFNQFQLQPTFDVMIIYDGLDTLAPHITTLTGSLGVGATVASTGSAITIRFISNNNLTFDGFEIVWSCNGNLLPPEASLFVEQDSDCENAVYVEATPMGIYDYTWDMGDGNVLTGASAFTYNYQTTGTYTISLEVSNAVGTSTVEETVDITDIPFTIDAMISADTVNIGEVFNMSAEADITPDSYTWIPQVGDTLSGMSNDYSYSAPGDYVIYLEATDAEGCMMFVEKPIHVRNMLGNEEISNVENFLILPNPSNGQFNVSIQFVESRNANLIVFNTLGQLIHTELLGTIDSANEELNLNKLAPGIYFISLVTDKGVAGVQRLVIQK